MKVRFWFIGVLAALPFLAASALADPVDDYLALRLAHQADKVQIAHVKAGPDCYHGKVFEVRGTVSGIAKRGSDLSFIIDCPDGPFIVSADESFNASSGARICALVQVGEKCTATLSDLKLVALAYQGEVMAREREADAERKAAQRAREMMARARFDRGNQASRSGVKASDYVSAYRNAIMKYNRKLSAQEADTIARSILGFSLKYQVDPRLVVSVILAESHFRPEATSRKGAMGLGQLMPGTAAGLGVSDPYDTVENIAGSVRVIRGHLDRISGNAKWNDLTFHDLALALASYNAGPGAVKKYGGVPPYRETRNYINKVISIYRELCPEE